MKKFIEVHDDIYPTFFINKVENLLMKEQLVFPYYYLHNATNSKSESLNPAFVHWFFKRDSHFITSDFITIPLKILYDFSYIQNIFIKEIINIRSFLETPSVNFGPDLPPHIDYHLDHWSLLYYVNDCEGDTILFKEDKKTEMQRISPKKGRVLFFDGSIPHCGTRSSNISRSIININFIGEKI